MEQQLIKQRRNDFIISFAGSNIDTTIVNIEEMEQYCIKRKRLAVVATEKRIYGELDRMNYQLVSNYTNPKVMVVNSKGKAYFDVYSFLLDRFKSGLLVVEGDTISEPISELLCKSDQLVLNDIDIMICRDGLESMTASEMRKANLMRIHACPDINPLIFQTLTDFYEEKAMGIMVAQFLANEQFDQTNKYFETKNEEYKKEGLTDCVDYYQLNKQLSFFVYYDVDVGKILNVDRQTVDDFVRQMKKSGILPIPEAHLAEISESLTLA
jgi:hypothetical protein